MADEGYFRLWNPQWCNSTSDNCVRSDLDGKRTMTIEIQISEAAAAVSQIGTAADNALDGHSAPASLYVVSSSADDTDNATKHVRAIHVIGISVSSAAAYLAGTEDPLYTVEEVRMNGTTNVRTVRYYIRVLHAYATEWGSGDADAAGNITCESPENTALVTIDAASNESNSVGMIYVEDGFWGRWERCYISLNDQALNQA